MQFAGPYSGRQHLSINDHILVGRTAINRYDFGVSEEKGVRQTMEKSCTIVQHMNITPLCILNLFPTLFLGYSASTYLSGNLHKNVSDALNAVAGEIIEVIAILITMTSNCRTRKSIEVEGDGISDRNSLILRTVINAEKNVSIL